MAVKVPVRNGNIEGALSMFRKKSSDTRSKVRENETYESRGKKRKRQRKEAARKSKQGTKKNYKDAA